MTVAHPTNLPASVKQRLLNLSKQKNVEFNILLTQYTLERLLYRISVSPHRDRFILKGALLFWVWIQELHRTTRDADFLDIEPSSMDRLSLDFREICDLKTEADGVQFLPESVRATEIRGHNAFKGIRVNLAGMLGKAKIPLQIDFGFGDACIPPPELIAFPVLLDFPAPRLNAYARETMIAEKFHAAVDLGMRNSRMKDYFDIFYLSQKFDFKGKDLSEALIATFERQRTPIPWRTPRGLSYNFAMDPIKKIQWNSFLIQTNAMFIDKNFAEVVESVCKFLMPAARKAARGERFDLFWPPGGPWRPED
jgi:predicted nucleotidyltransferase component of viral defense system